MWSLCFLLRQELFLVSSTQPRLSTQIHTLSLHHPLLTCECVHTGSHADPHTLKATVIQTVAQHYIRWLRDATPTALTLCHCSIWTDELFLYSPPLYLFHLPSLAFYPLSLPAWWQSALHFGGDAEHGSTDDRALQKQRWEHGCTACKCNVIFQYRNIWAVAESNWVHLLKY